MNFYNCCKEGEGKGICLSLNFSPNFFFSSHGSVNQVVFNSKAPPPPPPPRPRRTHARSSSLDLNKFGESVFNSRPIGNPPATFLDGNLSINNRQVGAFVAYRKPEESDVNKTKLRDALVTRLKLKYQLPPDVPPPK